MAMGRPTKLNEHLVKEFIKHTLEGAPRGTVCDLLSISHVTFYNWKQRAEAAELRLVGGDVPDGDELLYHDFFNRVRAAEAKFKIKLIKRMQRKGEPYQRDLSILERRDRGNWGKIEVVHNLDHEPKPAEGTYSDEDLEKIIAQGGVES